MSVCVCVCARAHMMMMGHLCHYIISLCILREQHKLQNCSNGAPLLLTSGPAKCEEVHHGCGTSPVCLSYAIATVFHSCHGGDMMHEMRTRKPEPTFVPTQRIVNLPHNIGMV